MFNFEESNKRGKEAMDVALKGYSDVAKGFQAITTETAEYSKKSFQDAAAHMESLAAVRSIESYFELQSNFARSYYEGFVSEATKLGEMYADLAKTVYRPYEAPVAKAAGAVAAKVASAA